MNADKIYTNKVKLKLSDTMYTIQSRMRREFWTIAGMYTDRPPLRLDLNVLSLVDSTILKSGLIHLVFTCVFNNTADFVWLKVKRVNTDLMPPLAAFHQGSCTLLNKPCPGYTLPLQTV